MHTRKTLQKYMHVGKFTLHFEPQKLSHQFFNCHAVCTGRGPIIAIFCLFSVSLFLYHSVHPFKYPVILNVTLRLTFDENIFNFPVHAHIRDPLQSC